MKLVFDSEINVLYIKGHPTEFHETIEVGPDVYMDVDTEGRIIGIEFLDPDYLIQFLREHGGELDFDKPASQVQSLKNS
jgi:uncharacterized protein YuzE